MPIVDTLNPALLALMVGIVVEILKNFIELKIKPDNPLHDNLIRVVSISLGVLTWGLFIGWPYTAPALLLLLYNGGLIGLGAVVGYHGITQVLPAFFGKVSVDKPTGSVGVTGADLTNMATSQDISNLIASIKEVVNIVTQTPLPLSTNTNHTSLPTQEPIVIEHPLLIHSDTIPSNKPLEPIIHP